MKPLHAFGRLASTALTFCGIVATMVWLGPDLDAQAQAEQAEARQQHASASTPPRRKHGSDDGEVR